MNSTPYRNGKWLPSDKKVIDEWMANLIKEVKVKSKDKLELLLALHPLIEQETTAMERLQSAVTNGEVQELGIHKPVQDLMNAILTDPEINMLFHRMFCQQFTELPDASKGTGVQSWQMMIIAIDFIMTTAPKFNKTPYLAVPIYLILNSVIDTTAGFAVFLNDKVNWLFKNILNYWALFLSSPDSRYVLSEDPRWGWFGEDAMEAMPNFAEEFKCNPQAEYYGFKSWDDFFTREFRPGIRPVDNPDDDYIVVNACESAPFKISRHVKQRDLFWIKNQHYSLDFMLNMSDLAKQFYGGTVYQGFLGITSYHRWHSPVSGTIYKTELVDGSYYSQTNDIDGDLPSPILSQGYLCHVAARGIVYIMADNPDIGLMCFISVGMSEVSSNDITVKEGNKVIKGDQLGMFHFGGSTHCLIFRPEVKIEFDTRDQTPGLNTYNIPVRAKIATVFPAHKK